MNRHISKAPLRLLGLLLFLAISAHSNANTAEKVNGTTGTPIGGFGAGGVKFNANNGTFAIMTRPPADAYDFEKVNNSRFQFYSSRDGVVETKDTVRALLVDGRPDDDAIWPLHRVNFGRINGVQLQMTGFSPLDPRNYDDMSLPYAFYEIQLTNTQESPVEVAVALQWQNADEAFHLVKGQGMASHNMTILAESSARRAVVSGGNAADKDFFKSGKCSQQVDQNAAKVAVSLKLKANETRTVKLVISWYNTVDPDLAYYFNLFDDSESVAQHGLKRFDELKANAEELVTRFRASNVPDWLKNQTLNTLVNLTTNSMYKRDGRVAFAEGQWTCFGTMDQMWHARQIVSQLVPFYAWQELRYWARTQMKNGQIHHDFNQMGDASEKEKRSVLVAWDDTEHQDYRNIQKWVDLNCAMIISTYETYRITGNKEEFDFLWPYLKKAAQRILDQVEAYGSEEFPYTFDDSENSYDAGGDPNPFNASLSAVAYKIMTILASEKGEPAIADRYQKAMEQVVQSFEARYLQENRFPLGKHSEGYFTGQWLALHLKLGELWTKDKTDFVLEQLDSYYHPYYLGLDNDEGTYDEWTPYILTHYAGLLLNTQRGNQWWAMQKDAYERQYLDRNKVFNHPLNILPKVTSPTWIANNTHSDKQYISMPGIWRNYYDLIGYSRDLRTNGLWLKPSLPEEMGHELKDALFITPEGYGTISCSASGLYDQNKVIEIKPDFSMTVSTLYLEDNYGDNVNVTIDGKQQQFKRIGSGYAKELAIDWNGKIGKNGIRVSVNGDPGMAPPALPAKPKTSSTTEEDEAIINPYQPMEAESATTTAGVTISKAANKVELVSSCNNFDYIQFSNVDFGKQGAIEFFVRVASPQNGATIEIMLDNVAGEVIGNCTIPNTGSYTNWETASCQLEKTTGVHDLILRFSGATADDLMHLDKLMFREQGSELSTPFK